MLQLDDRVIIGRGVHSSLELLGNIVELSTADPDGGSPGAGAGRSEGPPTAHPDAGPGVGGGHANYRKLFYDLEALLRQIESEILKDHSIKPPPPPVRQGTTGV